MTDQTDTQIATIMAHIQETWGNLNVLFDDLMVIDGWDRKHGPDWVLADVPYHLAYCNQDILIRSLAAGKDLPEEEQELLPDVAAINAWNARKFAERPASQTPAQSVAQWRETCDEIARLTGGMTDVALDRPFWMMLILGWANAREGLEFTRAHEWGEFMQLRIHMGRHDPVPSAGVTRAYLQRMLSMFPMFLNVEAAAGQDFTAVMAFTDPDVGAFTLQVTDGSASLQVGETTGADLIIAQSAETFLKTLNRMHDPAAAMQSGEIQINDFLALAAFGQLFPVG